MRRASSLGRVGDARVTSPRHGGRAAGDSGLGTRDSGLRSRKRNSYEPHEDAGQRVLGGRRVVIPRGMSARCHYYDVSTGSVWRAFVVFARFGLFSSGGVRDGFYTTAVCHSLAGSVRANEAGLHSDALYPRRVEMNRLLLTVCVAVVVVFCYGSTADAFGCRARCVACCDPCCDPCDETASVEYSEDFTACCPTYTTSYRGFRGRSRGFRTVYTPSGYSYRSGYTSYSGCCY